MAQDGGKARDKEWEDLDDFVEYENEDETQEERTARLEAKELEKQIAQKKRMLDSLAVSRKATEYRRREEEARKTLEKMQEEIDMLHRAEETAHQVTPSEDTVRPLQDLQWRSSAGDPESPLSMNLQNQPWPTGFKMPIVVMFDGELDPREFVISFEAAVESAG